MKSYKLSALVSLVALVTAGLSVYESRQVQRQANDALGSASKALEAFQERYSSQTNNYEGLKQQYRQLSDQFVRIERELDVLKGSERPAPAMAMRPFQPLDNRQNREMQERVRPRLNFRRRAFLGVVPDELTAPMAEKLKYPQPRGLRIVRVIPGTPAQRAGLQNSDVLWKLNGQEMKSIETLQRAMREVKPDDVLDLEVYRRGEAIQMKVPLGVVGR